MAMTTALTAAVLFALPKLLGIPEGTIDSGGGGVTVRVQPPVLVIKSGRVRAFQDVADAFQERCRVRVQQVYIGENAGPSVEMRERMQTAQVLVAVGQPAMDALQGVRAHVVYALAPDPPSGVIGTNSIATPLAAFRAITQLRPSIKRIGVIFSARAAARMQLARVAAKSLGLELIERQVANSPEAIRAIHSMIQSAAEGAPGSPGAVPIDALWVGPDPQLVDTQVLHFLQQVQIEWRIPVLAGTRQLVSSGALLAVDWSPEVVGQHLAWQVNHLLDDPDHIELLSRDHPLAPPETVVNVQAARRLGISLESVRGLPNWKLVE